MDLDERYRALTAELAALGVRLRRKDRVWHQRAIDWLWRGGYLHQYVTTIGRTIYVTPDWEARPVEDRYLTLRHERVHVEQFRRFGLVPMALAYLLLPLPVGLAWCRMALERQAYAETVRAAFALGGRAATDRLRTHVIHQYLSRTYGWMWPFPRAVARWYDALVAALERGPVSG
jgi:hypothetical protein